MTERLSVANTSDRLHCELVRILFLQSHRETDRFFAASGVDLEQTHGDFFQCHRTAFYSQLKSEVGSILVQSTVLRINLNMMVLL